MPKFVLKYLGKTDFSSLRGFTFSRREKSKLLLKSLFAKKANSGFTLIEIIMSLAIIAMIGVFALPTFKRYADEQILRNATQEITQLVRKAQNSSQSRIKCADGNPSAAWGVRFRTSTSYEFVSKCQDPASSYTLSEPPIVPTPFSGRVYINMSPPEAATGSMPALSPPTFISPTCTVGGVNEYITYPVTIWFYNSQNSATFASSFTDQSPPSVCTTSIAQPEKFQFQFRIPNGNLVSTVTFNRGGEISATYK